MSKKKQPVAQPGLPKAGLPEQIKEAFAAVPYPGDDQIVPNPLEWEADEIAAVFKGKDWRTISTDVLGRYAGSLYHFTPAAYRFFLPAYLLAEVIAGPPEKASAWGHLIRQPLEWSLFPPRGDKAGMAAFRRRMDPLTSGQKAAIRAFLHWANKKGQKKERDLWRIGHLSDIERALRDYWEDAE
jgi:hypothetical protein